VQTFSQVKAPFFKFLNNLL